MKNRHADNHDAVFRRGPKPNPNWPESAEHRIDMIGANGGDGLHYSQPGYQISQRYFLMARLGEEAGEVVQAILKSVQYGEDDVWEGVSNTERAQKELRELIALAEHLGFDLTPDPDKMPRVFHWMNHAIDRGVVQGPRVPE